MRKVLVVSDSPALRETVEIILGDQFAVETRASSEGSAPGAEVALVVVDSAALLPGGDAPVISIGDTRFRSLAPGRRRQYLPESFDALALREAAAMLTAGAEGPLAAGAEAPALSPLTPPFLQGSQVEVAARAVRTALPLCIWGEAGCGKLRLARAVHSARGSGYFHCLSAQEANRTDLRLPEHLAATSEATVVVTALEEIEAGGHRRLAQLLEAGSIDDAGGNPVPARLMVTAAGDPNLLVRRGVLSRDLFYRLSVLTLPLQPLRQRSEDVVQIARAVAATLCRRLDLPQVSFTEAAQRRLRHYLWFGNVAELEAVLARSLVFATGPVLDARDLRFGYGDAVAAASATAGAAPPSPSPSAGEAREPHSSRWEAANGDAVDLIIHELAHEFKNPMVTIKTFAHQLDHVLERDGSQEEFARLTGEAVERMDAALENLVQYTRFDAPSRQPTSLGSIIGSALGGVEELVAEKQLALEVEPTAAQVLVDPSQCSYALRNLLRAVGRDLSQGDALAVRAPSPSKLAIEYPARARRVASSLSRLVAGDAEDNDALPLGFSFAKSLIERNGGHLEVDRNGDVARVTLEFPLVGDGKGENGQAEGTDRR